MITLDNLRPNPIKESFFAQSDIWATTCNFEQGKRYLVTATSGKGKSTLLHSIYGLRKDYKGKVLIDQKDSTSLNQNNWADLRQKRFSIIFQDLRLFPDLTAWENIAVKSKLAPTLSEEELKDFAKELGIFDLLDRPTNTLSYGQRQRVAIIRALAQPFDFLLLDEPFSHLDEGNIKIACEIIKKVCAQQKAGFILVSLGEKYDFDYDVYYNL